MKIQVFIERENKKMTINMRSGENIGALLRRLGINREDVLVVRGRKLVTEDAVLREGERIKILSVISGG